MCVCGFFLYALSLSENKPQYCYTHFACTHILKYGTENRNVRFLFVCQN